MRLQTQKLGMSATVGLENEQLPAWRQPPPKVVRPPTPTADEQDERADEDDFSNAVLLLQKLIRGRAVQNIMFEGTYSDPGRS